jgi:para-aminobenzoate synthetase/4-amino-4-deoxychorismate lyase
MPTAVFGPLTGKNSSWQLQLKAPHATKQAHNLAEVIPVLEFAQKEANSGRYVSLLLAYESAPAFDAALSSHDSSSFPLAWAASFNDSEAISQLERAPYSISDWSPRVDQTEYSVAVHRIHELIAAGDTYQVNYTFPLTAAFEGNALSWYQELCELQPVPFSVYLDLGKYKVLSLSPELFFERRGDHMWTRPMKGTAGRGRTQAEDLKAAEWLKNSAKDRAENVMIVDLLRNDLGKVSQSGSVKVTSLFDVEKYETVWQMTSTVESTLLAGTSLVDLMRALFPCGSITGAPKIRTTEIIKELEPFSRGAYTGTIGLIRPSGDCIFNVAIRTIVIDSESGVATFGVGGGVTIDSTPELEYAECLVKSRFLQGRAQEFDLFESILLDQGEFFLLERHLQRLRESAEYFSFSVAEQDVVNALAQVRRSNSTGMWKVRVAVSREGRVELQTTDIGAGIDQVKKVSLASRSCNSTERFLYHKTTRREFYEDERRAQPEFDDVIFWNERGEITESTIANVVIERDGRLITPPVDAGLLAGTFRSELLAEGKLEEGVILIDELRNTKKFYLINSVRKWMPAILS